MRNALCEQICQQVCAIGGTAVRCPGSGVILINGNITAKVTFSTGRLWRTDQTVWTIVLGRRSTADILIIARLNPPHRSVFDYYVVPAFSQLHGALHARKEGNAPFFDIHHFTTLQPLIEMFRRYPIVGHS
jgi:hypothetical protein